MAYSDQFFRALGVDGASQESVRLAVSKTSIPASRLAYYNRMNIVPSGEDLKRCVDAYDISEIELRLKMGRLDRESIALIQQNAKKY